MTITAIYETSAQTTSIQTSQTTSQKTSTQTLLDRTTKQESGVSGSSITEYHTSITVLTPNSTAGGKKMYYQALVAVFRIYFRKLINISFFCYLDNHWNTFCHIHWSNQNHVSNEHR